MKIICFKCKCTGHYAAECDNYKKNFLNYKQNNFGLFTSANDSTQALTISEEKMENLLYIDTGCVGHLCNNDSRFVNLRETKIKMVSLANNETTEVTSHGKTHIKAKVSTKLQSIEIHDALASEPKTNLLYIAKMCDHGYMVTFHEQHTVIKHFKNNVTFIADRKNDLYYL